KGRAWYAILGTKSQVHHEPPGIIRQLCKLHVYSSTYPKINSRRASQYFYPSLLVSLYHISESHHVNLKNTSLVFPVSMLKFDFKNINKLSLVCINITNQYRIKDIGFTVQFLRTFFTVSKKNDMVDQAVLDKLEAGFTKLQNSDSKSLLKKHLTKEIFDALKTKKSGFGCSLLDVIQSGVENLDSGVGIYAPDAESYTLFGDLFDPIIDDYHGGFKKTDKHPPKDFGDVDTLGNLDPTGTFYPLTGMSKEVQQKLIDDHFLFKEGDRFLQAANACRFWPTGRGIYHNDAKTFLVWCNEEDHLRIISMQMGGDLGQKRLPFSHHDRFGFLTFCPTNLGTTIRASVHIKVPKLAANKAKLEEVAGKFNLQVRGTRGEHTEAEGGIYDISNKRRLGLTEYQAVKEMHDGIAELIKIEKEL
ncbi:GSCOCG00005239001-RA-CDS, partial [Cotesia congregata]